MEIAGIIQQREEPKAVAILIPKDEKDFIGGNVFRITYKMKREAKLSLASLKPRYSALTKQAARRSLPSGHKGVPFNGQLTLGQAAVPSKGQAALLVCEP